MTSQSLKDDSDYENYKKNTVKDIGSTKTTCEIRNKIGLEITDMTFEQQITYLDKVLDKKRMGEST